MGLPLFYVGDPRPKEDNLLDKNTSELRMLPHPTVCDPKYIKDA